MRLPTGGLTNHAVSHSLSVHLLLIKASISFPTSLTRRSSSSVPPGDRMSLSIVIPQSESAGRYVGRRDGEGGGEFVPVKPHKPSWWIRGLTDSGKLWGNTGSRVQMRACSISEGTRAKKSQKSGKLYLDTGYTPEYGQSFIMMLISSGGVSAVKYGGTLEGRSYMSDTWVVDSFSPALKASLGIVNPSSDDGNRDNLSGCPHWSL